MENQQMSSIIENANRVLEALSRMERPNDRDQYTEASELAGLTELTPSDLNDAVTLLEESGLIEWIRYLGTAPYKFAQVMITPRGRYEIEKAKLTASVESSVPSEALRRPSPVGSPYGFVDGDWDFVTLARSRGDQLRVVLGHQFVSEYYDTNELRANVRATFACALSRYERENEHRPIELYFKPLAAGYGEHLFNDIAREIIAADVAVFETSDLNPNVMLKLGVALTWGVRCLPIKLEGRPKPPSDISGHTWADYRANASEFSDADHSEKLFILVQRELRKKPTLA
jgi:DNA-binding MarR family transcriptional regulator